MPSLALKRLVVLISGNGTNLQAILDACASGELAAQVVAVISNSGDAYGLERARRAGVPAHVLVKRKAQDRRDYDTALAELVQTYQPDIIVLAGWMRILTSAFIGQFPDRIINLHPALPGMFPGINSIARALDAFSAGAVSQTGVMVHRVPDEGVDSGPVLAQAVVPIVAGDSVESLSARVHAVEHQLLVDTLKQLVQSPR